MLHFAPQSLKPAFWPLRPDLTAGRRLWPNIRHLWPLQHGVDSVYDVAQGKLYSTTAGIDTTTRAGSAVQDLTTSAVSNPLDEDIANWRFAFLAHVDTASATAGQTSVVVRYGSPTFGFRIKFTKHGGGSFVWRIERLHAGNGTTVGGWGIGSSASQQMVMVVDSVNGRLKLWINGELRGDVALIAEEVATAADINFAGGHLPITYCGLLSGVPPDDEAAALSLDVFSPIRADPAKVIPLIVGDAGGAPATDVLPPGLHQIAQGNVGLSRAAHTIEEGFVT